MIKRWIKRCIICGNWFETNDLYENVCPDCEIVEGLIGG